MARTVTHQGKFWQRRETTVTGTLCNRMSNAADDLNVADTDDQVTCKFCLGLMDAARKRIADALDKSSRYLADSNEAAERGDKATAESLYLKSCSWLDRYNKLTGND